MPNISLWTKVAIAIQSALAAPDTITAISKATTGVVSSTAHGIANGAFVLLEVTGMTQVHKRVFRVANQAANTFELEGENTTNYDTFLTGTAKEITFGTTLATATTVSASGGNYDYEDTTTIHDSIRSQIPLLAAAANFAFENIWDVADAGLIALKAASEAKTERAIRITFSNGQKVLFNGFVGATLLPGGAAPGKVTTPVTLTMQSAPTVYAT
jgi:hypothetical protein